MDPTSPVSSSVAVHRAPGWPRAPRSLDAGRGAAWWGEGWRVFTASPALWIGLVLVLMIAIVLMGLVPILGNIAQALLWPVFAGGLLLGCHALAQGRPLQFEHLFAGFKERLVPLLILGVIALAVGAVIAILMMMLVFGAIGITGIAGLFSGSPVTMMNSALAGMGIASLIAIPVALGAYALFMMAWWFATPLVVLNGADAVAALKGSFDASWKNLGALVISLLIFLGLAIVASIPFFLGWLVLAPVAVGASYASWREVFGE